MRRIALIIASLAPMLLVASPAGGASKKTVAALPPPADVPIALLVDLSSGQTLYAREADRRFVPASITKVMTLYTAAELIRQGKLSPEQRLTMSTVAAREWSRKGSTMFLSAGATVSVDELLRGISTVSANDASIVLAEGAAGSVAKWVALMNANALALGMKDSRFGTPNGWMDDGGTFVTAHDLVLLGKALLERHPAFYHRYVGHKFMTYKGITQENHDPLIGVVQGADGIKTGYTRQAGYGYLGSAERDGRRLIMVVAAADRPATRRDAARAFMEWGFSAFHPQRLIGGGVKVSQARVQGGAMRHVGLVTTRALFTLSNRDTRDRKPRYSIRYDGPVPAPVKAGQQIARLVVHAEGQEPFSVPLAAAQDVPVANWWQRVRNGLFGLVS